MKVTFEEWCELTGTTTGEMAGAQEMAEREDWESELKRKRTRKENTMSEKLDEGAVEAIGALSNDVITGANELVVNGEDDLKLASFILGGIKDLLYEAEVIFKPVAQATDRAHKEAVAAWNKVRSPLSDAQKRVKGRVSDYHNRMRAEADAARRKAEAEERAREEERRLAAAVQLEDAGHEDAAEVVLETPAKIVKPMITTPPPAKTKGMTTTTTYTANVVNVSALLAWVLATGSWDLVDINKRALNRYAKAGKEDFDLPGCELVIDTQVSSRKR